MPLMPNMPFTGFSVKGLGSTPHRAYMSSVYHFARHVSKIRVWQMRELDGLSEQVLAGVTGESSSIKPEDLEIAQQVLNEMNKRHDMNMNPTGKAWVVWLVAGLITSGRRWPLPWST